jgi:para-aminobenzoate synthetase
MEEEKCSIKTRKMQRHRILFLDAYDSFTNNIVSLLTNLLQVDVFVLPIDDPSLDPNSATFDYDFRRELSRYSAVVCGPGPGSPGVDADVGLMKHVWRLRGADLVPVLGICLGFQSLVESFGGSVRRLRRGLHGMVREIEHRGGMGSGSERESGSDGFEADIFTGVAPFKATAYHSLCADIGQDSVPDGDWASSRWRATDARCPDLVPLAWAMEDRGYNEKERILMAVRHRTKPFWGLQYHPESVCTDGAGHAVMQNWFREAIRWNGARSRALSDDGGLLARKAQRPSLLSEIRSSSSGGDKDWNGSAWAEGDTGLATFGLNSGYHSRAISLPPNVTVPDVVEILGSRDGEHIILDSANSDPLANGAKNGRGRYSIIALGVEQSVRIEHQAGKDFATARLPSFNGVDIAHAERVSLASDESIWHVLSGFLQRRRIGLGLAGGAGNHFRGGFMGYVTYEMGLHGIGVQMARDRSHDRPDVFLVWVTRSIVIDHVQGLLHIQELHRSRARADAWIQGVVSKLQSSHLWQHDCCKSGQTGSQIKDSIPINGKFPGLAEILVPESNDYERKVRECQEYIAAGESYELCLTDQTTITRPRRRSSVVAAKARSQPDRLPSAWQLYRSLRLRQPAPFASYLRIGCATLISSSPERFLEYTAEGLCSMRPMKGTVRKSDTVSTLTQAETILHVPKEEAENLMIVDLVRHDLHGVCGPGNVTVPHLMKVEEYASVFQMITVVNGQLPQPRVGREGERYTGFDVLAASLPPGSMTGAPKKRSCEILQEIEGGRERGLYSGVVGYMDVTGKGDWSVTIRSLFRWDDEAEIGVPHSSSSPTVVDRNGGLVKDFVREVWRIGAGGAVTILSTPEGEREEMFTKLAGPLGVFGNL